jgi:hypothetical protein
VSTAPDTRPNRYTLGFLAWLGMFLVLELPAAKGEAPGTVKTLSRHFWRRWFPRPYQRVGILLAVGVALALHLSLEAPVPPFVVLGAWMGATIAWVELAAWWARKHTGARLRTPASIWWRYWSQRSAWRSIRSCEEYDGPLWLRSIRWYERALLAEDTYAGAGIPLCRRCGNTYAGRCENVDRPGAAPCWGVATWA